MSVLKKDLDFIIQTRNFDINDIIKPASVFEYFQDIAAIHAKELNLGYEDLLAKGLAWVVLYERYEIIKMPEFLEKVTVSTWPKPKGRLEFEREYLISNKIGESLIKGTSNWVVIDLSSRSFVRTDKIDYNGEYYEFTNYNEKIKRKLNLDTLRICDWFEFKVQFDDLDHNGHLNNTKYLSYICNDLFKTNIKKYCKSCEIAFIKEAKLNDLVKVGHYKIDDYNEAYIGYLDDYICFECILTLEVIK